MTKKPTHHQNSLAHPHPKIITCQGSPTMNPTELAARRIKGEDFHTEFMEHLTHADDLAASIIAFANTDGGQMIFGVRDKREITGLGDETDHVLQFIDNIAFNNCEPPVTIVQETVRDQQGRIVVIVNIPEGGPPPVSNESGCVLRADRVRTQAGVSRRTLATVPIHRELLL
ncbi:MAG: AlbA family DNA-binding domain-containing protein [Methanosarcinaceae archaeon]